MSSAPRLSRGGAVALAAAFGLGTGLMEAAVLAIRHYGFGRLIHVGPHFGWMAPVADLAIFGLAGLGFVALSLVWRRLPARLPLFVYCWFAAAALLLMLPGLHPYALVLIAAGVGVQGSAWLVRRSAALERAAPRVLALEGLLVLVLAGAAFGSRALAERRTLAALPQPRAGAPNVLLIILDTVRAMHLSLYGYPRATTPHLAALGRQGVVYDAAYSTAPWTLPSHASLFTGRWPHELSADWEVPLDGTYPTLAEALDRAGYRTGGFAANVGYCSWEFGLNRGFARYRSFPLTWQAALQSTSLGRQLDRSFRLRRLLGTDQHLVRVHAPRITSWFLHWLDRDRGRPFFAFLNYYDAHGPYLPPAPWDRAFAPGGRPNNLSPLHRFLAHPRRTPPPESVVQAEVDQYDGALAYLDDQIGKLVDSLRQRGLLEHTVVIITADHGEEFGEHGAFDHGNTLYRAAVHVPLLVLAPGAPAGLRVTSPVSLHDIAATIADRAGLGPESPFPGRSLARTWGDSSTTPILSEVRRGIRTPPWYPVSRGDMYALVRDDRHYIRNGDGTEELYDLAQDGTERHNLAAADSLAPALAALRSDLRAVVPALSPSQR